MSIVWLRKNNYLIIMIWFYSIIYFTLHIFFIIFLGCSSFFTFCHLFLSIFWLDDIDWKNVKATTNNHEISEREMIIFDSPSQYVQYTMWINENVNVTYGVIIVKYQVFIQVKFMSHRIIVVTKMETVLWEPLKKWHKKEDEKTRNFVKKKLRSNGKKYLWSKNARKSQQTNRAKKQN